FFVTRSITNTTRQNWGISCPGDKLNRVMKARARGEYGHRNPTLNGYSNRAKKPVGASAGRISPATIVTALSGSPANSLNSFTSASSTIALFTSDDMMNSSRFKLFLSRLNLRTSKPLLLFLAMDFNRMKQGTRDYL